VTAEVRTGASGSLASVTATAATRTSVSCHQHPWTLARYPAAEDMSGLTADISAGLTAVRPLSEPARKSAGKKAVKACAGVAAAFTGVVTVIPAANGGIDVERLVGVVIFVSWRPSWWPCLWRCMHGLTGAPAGSPRRGCRQGQAVRHLGAPYRLR
jgi:hypothetical protein